MTELADRPDGDETHGGGTHGGGNDGAHRGEPHGGGTDGTHGDGTDGTHGDGAHATGDVPGGARRGWSLTRWLVVGAVAFLVVLLMLVGTITYGAVRLVRTTDARNDASDRFRTACEQLETRLNRLVPPGAARDPDDRAAAVRAENVAVGPVLSELRGMPDDIDLYDTVLTDWQALVSARERFAEDLVTQAHDRRRPAFFLMPRDSDGADRIDRLFDQSPQRCAAALRRLTAPDL